MDFIKETANEKHPVVQLIFLGLLVFGGILVCLAVSLVVIYLCYGQEVMLDLLAQKMDQSASVNATKILLTIQQLFVFLLPALLLGVTESKRPNHFYDLGRPQMGWLSVVFLLMIVSLPFMAWITGLNQQMSFPQSLKWLENWMRNLENEGAETTKAILKMTSLGALLVNLFVIALMPAICEEFIFRGALQRCFLRWMQNPHVAIWLSAAIFSAIHLQFFGFFPRMFLGAMFGYIYFFTKSIWYTVFAHFLNNGYAVCVAFYLQKNNLPIDQDETGGMTWYFAAISLVLTVALFRFLRDQTSEKELAKTTYDNL